MRHAILEVTPEIIIEILKSIENGFKGRFEILKGLPDDTEFIDMYAEPTIMKAALHPHVIHIKIKSKRFEDIQEGKMLPILEPPILRRRYDNKGA